MTVMRRLVSPVSWTLPVRHSTFRGHATSMFNGKLVRRNVDGPSTLSSNTINILHVNASHSPTSLVAQASSELFSRLKFEHEILERNLWSDRLVSYDVSHVAAKMRLLRGKGSPEDEEVFKPVHEFAEELNSSQVLVISTPMWNFSFPYVIKQYVDIAVQPGINFLERPERPVTTGKVLVLITSSGGAYADNNPRDYLNKYLEDVFNMVGFQKCYSIRIQGAAQQPREKLIEFLTMQASDVARALNETIR